MIFKKTIHTYTHLTTIEKNDNTTERYYIMKPMTPTTHHAPYPHTQQDVQHDHTTPFCGYTVQNSLEEQQDQFSLAPSSLPSYDKSQQHAQKLQTYSALPSSDTALVALTNQEQEPPSSLRKWSVKGAQLLWKSCVNTQKFITTKLAKLGKHVVPKEIKEFHKNTQTHLHNAKPNFKQRARVATHGLKMYLKNAIYCSGIGTLSGVTIGTVAVALLAANPLLALPACFFASLALGGTGSVFGLGVGLVGPFIKNPFKEAEKCIQEYEIKKLHEQNHKLQHNLQVLFLENQIQALQTAQRQQDLIASAPPQYVLTP